MENIEFRVSPDGNVYYKKSGEEEKRLTRFCAAVYTNLMDLIMSRFPGAWARLSLLYPAQNKTKVAVDIASYKRVERFIRCNFGEHDLLTSDIEKDILNFEEVRCPLRGICNDENIICKPQTLFRLSPAEREVVKLYLHGYTFKEISEKLDKSPSTVKVQLSRIKRKVGARNCREIIKVMRIHNL